MSCTKTLGVFRAALDAIRESRGPSSPARADVALQLLHDYHHLPGGEFDAKYPAFLEFDCACGFETECTCTANAIVDWGLNL